MTLRIASFCVPAIVAAMMLPADPAVAQVRLLPRQPVDPRGEAERQPQTFEFTVDPAAEPVPALKYALSPGYLEQKPGNAAPFYYRALLRYKPIKRTRGSVFNDTNQKWMDGPLDELPLEELREELRAFGMLDHEGSVYQELRTAAYRDSCDWDLRLREKTGLDAVFFLIPEIHDMRHLARLLALKARLEIAEQRYDDALETLLVGHEMARDTSQPPTLIADLVGIACVSILQQPVRELIAAADSPNLYWALTALPDPIIEMQSAITHEKALPPLVFPLIRNAESVNHSPGEWRRKVFDAFRTFDEIERPGEPNAALDSLRWSLTVARGYPRAKRWLVEHGSTKEEVEAMSVPRLVAVYQARVYRYVADEQFKWTHLPLRFREERIRASERRLRGEGLLGSGETLGEFIPITRLVGAVANSGQRVLTMETKIAAMRALEAIRMYAAVHDGRLPKSLTDVKQVPVPDNPRTGEPFPYRVEDDVAILDVPQEHVEASWRFRIRIRKKSP